MRKRSRNSDEKTPALLENLSYMRERESALGQEGACFRECVQIPNGHTSRAGGLGGVHAKIKSDRVEEEDKTFATRTGRRLL